MPSEAWKRPFRELRDKLHILYESGRRLHHQLAFFPHYEAMDPQQCQDLLACTDLGFDGNKVVREIVTPGSLIAKHAHYFYGRNIVEANSAYLEVEEALYGAVDWIGNIPNDLVPSFAVPTYHDRRSESVIAWTALVYFLAHQIDAPYLSCEITCGRHDETLEPWKFWPQPGEFDPSQMLFHESNPYDEIEAWKEEFWEATDKEYYLPDLIESSLDSISGVRDFIASSITSIDCLLYIWEPLKAERQPVEAPPQPIATRVRSRSKRISDEVTILKKYLVEYHKNATGAKATTPLTWQEIATEMSWFNESGQPVQSRVNRRMEVIFGSRPMEKYQGMFAGRNTQRFLDKLNRDADKELKRLLDPDLDSNDVYPDDE